MGELTMLQVKIDRFNLNKRVMGATIPDAIVVEGVSLVDRTGLAVTPHINDDGTPSKRRGYCVTHIASGKRVGSRPVARQKAIALMFALYAMEGIDWALGANLLKTDANRKRVQEILEQHGVWA